MTGSNQPTASILVVDDEDSVRTTISAALDGEGYEVITSPNVPDAILKILQMKFHAAILDILMPDASGFELIGVMAKMCPETSIIVLTAMLDQNAEFKDVAESSGVFAYLRKPCKIQDLKDTLRKALDQQMTIS